MDEGFIKTGGAEPGNPGVKRPNALSGGEPGSCADEHSQRTWIIAGGNIPLRTTGPEPEMTSHDKICLLNRGDMMVHVRMMIYFEDQAPVGPFQITLGARRVRHIRINDLIFPQALPLATPYAALVRADADVVVQFTRQHTGARDLAITGTHYYGADNADD